MTWPVVLVALVLSGAGCKSKNPTSPTTTADVSGTWRGTITDPVAGSAQVTLTLRQINVTTALVNVGGTWQAGFAPGVRTASGVVTGGQEPADRWLIYLDPFGLPPCFDYPFPYSTHGQGFQLNLTRTGNRLIGTSTYRTCTESFQGSIDVTR